MTTDVKLLPLPEHLVGWLTELGWQDQERAERAIRDYARANMEPLLAENERLRAEAAEARDGWHMANGTADLAMKHRDEAEARAERLAEALRELEEREQRDEALLRQALGRAHQTAMEQTLKARIPECAEFAGIAQDLDFVVAALRERLGVKA